MTTVPLSLEGIHQLLNSLEKHNEAILVAVRGVRKQIRTLEESKLTERNSEDRQDSFLSSNSWHAKTAQTLHFSPARLMVKSRPTHRRSSSGTHFPRTMRRNTQLQICGGKRDGVTFSPEGSVGASIDARADKEFDDLMSSDFRFDTPCSDSAGRAKRLSDRKAKLTAVVDSFQIPEIITAKRRSLTRKSQKPRDSSTKTIDFGINLLDEDSEDGESRKRCNSNVSNASDGSIFQKARRASDSSDRAPLYNRSSTHTSRILAKDVDIAKLLNMDQPLKDYVPRVRKQRYSSPGNSRKSNILQAQRSQESMSSTQQEKDMCPPSLPPLENLSEPSVINLNSILKDEDIRSVSAPDKLGLLRENGCDEPGDEFETDDELDVLPEDAVRRLGPEQKKAYRIGVTHRAGTLYFKDKRENLMKVPSKTKDEVSTGPSCSESPSDQEEDSVLLTNEETKEELPDELTVLRSKSSVPSLLRIEEQGTLERPELFVGSSQEFEHDRNFLSKTNSNDGTTSPSYSEKRREHSTRASRRKNRLSDIGSMLKPSSIGSIGEAALDRINTPRTEVPQKLGKRTIEYDYGRRHLIFPLPSSGLPEDTQLPNCTLELGWSHGYYGSNPKCRCNLHLLRTGGPGDEELSLVYNTCGLVVRLNTVSWYQKFLKSRSHATSICTYTSGEGQKTRNWAAVGYSGVAPHITIFDLSTMEPIKDIITKHKVCIMQLGFSEKLNIIYSMGEDENHQLAGHDLIRLKQTKELFNAVVSKSPVFGFAVNPYSMETTCLNEADEIVTLGKEHLKYWSLTRSVETGKVEIKGRFCVTTDRKKCSRMRTTHVSATPQKRNRTVSVPQKRRQQRGDTPKELAYHCALFLPSGKYAVGGHSGTLYLMSKSDLVCKWPKAHQNKAITCMCNSSPGKENMKFITCGIDATWKQWTLDKSGEKLVQLNGNSFESVENVLSTPLCRSCAYDPETGWLYIGTKENQILRVSTLREQAELYVDGHAKKISAVAIHPEGLIYVTGSDDCQLKIWDSENNKPVVEGTYRFKDKVKSLCWSCDGEILAAGMDNSTVCILVYPPMRIGKLLKIKSTSQAQEISSLKFSPTSDILAVGHSNGKIYLYSVLNCTDGSVVPAFQRFKTTLMCTTSVIGLQFSSTGEMLRCFSSDYEVSIFDVDAESLTAKKKLYFVDPDLVSWHSKPLLAGWDVKGLYQPGFGGTMLRCVATAGTVAVSGDKKGLLRVHNFPAVKPGTHTRIEGHSAAVLDVAFDPSGEYLVSVGADRGIMIWDCMPREC